MRTIDAGTPNERTVDEAGAIVYKRHPDVEGESINYPQARGILSQHALVVALDALGAQHEHQRGLGYEADAEYLIQAQNMIRAIIAQRGMGSPDGDTLTDVMDVAIFG